MSPPQPLILDSSIRDEVERVGRALEDVKRGKKPQPKPEA